MGWTILEVILKQANGPTNNYIQIMLQLHIISKFLRGSLKVEILFSSANNIKTDRFSRKIG